MKKRSIGIIIIAIIIIILGLYFSGILGIGPNKNMDVNGDGVIDYKDAKIVGTCQTYNPAYDFNNDGLVNSDDSAIILENLD